MSTQVGVDPVKAQALLDRYMSTGRITRDHDLGEVLQNTPSVLERQSVLKGVKTKITDFINTFIEGI
jgi:hypothetical protein